MLARAPTLSTDYSVLRQHSRHLLRLERQPLILTPRETRKRSDTAALSYLQNWLSGTQPTTTNTTGMRSSSNAVFLQVTQRAKQLYTAATGQELPNMTTLTGQLGNLSTNNTLLNTINTQTEVIEKNFGLSLDNMSANNVNEAPPAINGTLDWLKEQAGSDSVAQYLEQNSTLTNEIGTLLSLKNASGTTVADKLAASEQVPLNFHSISRNLYSRSYKRKPRINKSLSRRPACNYFKRPTLST